LGERRTQVAFELADPTAWRSLHEQGFGDIWCPKDGGIWLDLMYWPTAWLASYFDILFPINRVLHPGEERGLEPVAAAGQIVWPPLCRVSSRWRARPGHRLWMPWSRSPWRNAVLSASSGAAPGPPSTPMRWIFGPACHGRRPHPLSTMSPARP